MFGHCKQEVHFYNLSYLEKERTINSKGGSSNALRNWDLKHYHKLRSSSAIFKEIILETTMKVNQACAGITKFKSWISMTNLRIPSGSNGA